MHQHSSGSLMTAGSSSSGGSNEYHEGVEACYRLAGEAKTETDRLA